ncbi:mannan endo-1,4-beta-mannosidase B [Physcia stellaris]|nr:mannan endo-1,4-beta-mannosidase B [Physcia stellaris]
MRFLSWSLALSCLQLDIGICSPLVSHQGLQSRARPTLHVCKAASVLVSKLQLENATPFCSSYLNLSPNTVAAAGTSTSVETTTSMIGSTTGLRATGIPGYTSTASLTQIIKDKRSSIVNATLIITETQTRTETETAAGGPPTTSTVFKPGNPPVAAMEKRDNDLEERNAPILTPNCAKEYPAAQLSIACSCLNVPVPTTTVVQNSTTQAPETTTAATTTTTITQTTTTTQTPQPTIYTTIYPCAAPLPSPGPAYGDYASSTNLSLQNTLFYLNTPQGNSASSCCNTCFFGVANCIQAYWYFYEGCVVSQAMDLGSATGLGNSTSCPAGAFGGSSYGPDVNPAFRSTGNFVGPCGERYANF